MGFTMKRLCLAGVLILVLLGIFLAGQKGLFDKSGNSPDQQQTTAKGSATDTTSANLSGAGLPQSPASRADSPADVHSSSASDPISSEQSGMAATGAVAGADADAVAGKAFDKPTAIDAESSADTSAPAHGTVLHPTDGAATSDMPSDAAATADAAADAVDEGAAPGEAVTKGTFEKGDTVSKVLENAGGQGVHQYVSAAQQVFSMRSFREGQPYVVVTDKETGQVKRFEYEIDSRRRLVVEGAESPAARVEPIEYIVLLSSVEATINDNLFQAVADIGENPQMALKLADLFGAEVNFIRDLQAGDSFSVLVEKRYRDSEYKGYGRILAAHFTNKGKTYEAYLFRDGKQRAEYYNRKGENLRKTLLQAPLAFTRISSRFTNSRLHPILNTRRAHHGVDYAAPTGTPVKAVGDGMITQRGWAGGYGNQIIVKHVAGLESMYAHLSGYARGIATGQRVRQGQVIGFVGSTGMSTGPHLDFRLRQNGKFIDPTKAINPRGEPVARKAMPEFEKIMALELAYLKGTKNLSEYEADSLVPDAPVTAPEKPVEKEKKKPAQKGRR